MRWVLGLMMLAGSALAGPGWADGKLDGKAIGAALTGKVLAYDDGSTQSFMADGETVYNKGSDSIGHWQVEGDRYCSVWPPSDHWACYDVTAAGAAISFVADGGSASVGHLKN